MTKPRVETTLMLGERPINGYLRGAANLLGTGTWSMRPHRDECEEEEEHWDHPHAQGEHEWVPRKPVMENNDVDE